MDALSDGSRINAYPNPTDRVLFIDVAGPLANSGALSVDVLDQSGRVVRSGGVLQGRTSISTAFLAEGMYAFVLKRNGEPVHRGRFTVLHGLY
jgi:hypothetical protein